MYNVHMKETFALQTGEIYCPVRLTKYVLF